MTLEDVLLQIIEDLPWVDNVRLVVGPLASRETVKDELLRLTEAIPAWAVGTLGEMAKEILAGSGQIISEKPLSLASQCDALERMALNPVLKNRASQLCVHLKSRPVALKIARFLSGLERFYVHQDELEAIVEYFQTKDPNLGAFTAVVAQLWNQGELQPWGEGWFLRKALGALEGDRARPLPSKIYFWGFAEFTPLEEALLEKLAHAGVELNLLHPASLASVLEPRCSALGMQAITLETSRCERAVWEPHSAWDELEFLRDELARLRQQNVRWDEIAIFAPDNDLYKRLIRQKLHGWNVPILDPTLSGGWKDRPDWVWWRDLLRTISGGLKLDDVRAWIAARLDGNTLRKKLFDATVEHGVHGGATQWERLAKRLNLTDELPELHVLIEGTRIWARSMTPLQFLDAAEKFVALVEERLNIEERILLEFARHLCEERPFLENFRARLPRYVALFEEYLEVKSRALSMRNFEGIRFVAHGVWLPRAARYSFVLGANTLARAKPPADAWDFEGLEVRKAWEKLHFGMPWSERVARDEALLLHGLTAHGHVTFSAPEYDLSGKPLPKAYLYQQFKGEAVPLRLAGHPSVGWTIAAPQSAREFVRRPDLLDDSKMSAFSVSAFEDYLRCPFIYYARHVLRVSPEEELGLDPNGRARGDVLHRVLRRFIEEEMAGKTPSIEAIVDDELRTKKLPGLYRHQPLIEKTRRLLKAYAKRWLEWEYENRRRHPDLKPFLAEKPVEVEVAPGFILKGRPDRVDSDGKRAVVIDYKSGGAPMIGRELREGIGAQLVTYARAMEVSHGLEPAAMYYLSIGRKTEGKSGVFFKKYNNSLHSTHARNSGLVDGEFGALFEQITERWVQSAENLRAGDFQPAPARGKRECASCAYEPVCGWSGDEDVD